MNTSSRVGTFLSGALIVAFATVGAVSAPAVADRATDSTRIAPRLAGPVAPATLRAGPTSSTGTTKVQRVNLKWKGGWKKPTFEKSAVIPGIGNVALVCKPSSVMVRLFANERNAETQMWMAKHEVKNGRNVVAVKNARIYRYDHPLDNGKGGTGRFAHEGLNQRSPIENYSSGYIDGVISQRPSRNQSVKDHALKPVTSFRLNWYWNGFDYPKKYQFCQFDAVFKTTFPTRLGVNWHGEADAENNVLQVSRLPSIGDLNLRCGTNDDGGGGVQSISLVPNDKDARVYAETISGEGDVEDHIDQFSKGYDPETGRVGPIPLPRNGMMRVFYTVGGVTRPFIVSSYYVTNRADPERNMCELAAAPY